MMYKFGGFTSSDIKTFYKASMTKTVHIDKRQTNRLMEQNRKSRNRLTQVYSGDFLQTHHDNSMREGKISTNSSGTNDNCIGKKELHSTYKN